MAAPTVTPRQPPTGIRLRDGHASTIAFAAAPAVSFWEKSTKPPGVDGGDPIDTLTHFNTVWRPKRPRSLKSLSDVTVTAAYDPAVMTQIIGLVNVENAITIEWHDGSTVAFWGYLRTVEFSELTEGAQPELTATITPTNVDPSDGSEAGPVITSVPGT